MVGTLIGILAGALQGYFGGRFDLLFQRFIEVWGSMPELYLLIIFSAIFQPSIALLLILLSLFGWLGLADYVRAEFLRGRNMDYVKAARALGVSNRAIMLRHLLPNSMTPVITFLPFRVSGRDPGAHQPGFSRPRRAAFHPQPGRAAGAGQGQYRGMVAVADHFQRAGRDAGAADLYRRGLARSHGYAAWLR